MDTPLDGSRTILDELGPLRVYLKRYRLRLVLGVLCQLFSTGLAMIVPWLTKNAIDGLINHLPFSRIREIALAILGANIALGLFLFLMRWFIITTSRFAEYDLRNDLYTHLAALPRGFYDRFSTGDLMSRLTNDLNAVRMLLGPAILQSSNTIFYLIFALFMLITIDPLLTAIAMAILLVLPFVVYRISRLVRVRSERVQEGLADINTHAQENLNGMRVVKSYNLEQGQSRGMAALSARYRDLNLALVRVQALFFPLMLTISGIASILVLFFGGRFVILRRITIGELVAFMSYLTMLTWPMFAIGWVISMAQRGAASMRRINVILREQPVPEPNAPMEPDFNADPVVRFEHVDFRYAPDRPLVLKDVSLTIKRGEVVALMGLTGAGKSTLAHLLSKTYAPDRGTVYLFGAPLQQIATSRLRRHIGMVPQEITLFSDTIQENIAFGVAETSRDSLLSAAELAHFAPDVQDLPLGYETLLGERGINLSGGQKQRLTLARAILPDPELLILDDPFSSVDISTEESILDRFDAIRGSGTRTVIIISHRVNTARRADRIIMLHGGTVVEDGPHHRLRKSGGLYQDMYERQQLEEELSRM
ncbi:ABC transporter ATP-binding protein [bacterium]|nr:ABC transporter ATP-binding protein [candidate division CSSED10-310 bacterium]